MGITSVLIGGLEVNDNVKYGVSNDTLAMLESASPHDPVMVDMTNRPPAYIRTQVLARPITLTVYMLRPDAEDRKADYDDLKTAIDPSFGLVTLEWTDDIGPVTKTLFVHASGCIPSDWMTRASSELVAPNPDPIVT